MSRIVAILFLLSLACSAQPDARPTGTAVETTKGRGEILDSLRRANLRVESAGEVEQPFWTRKAQVFTVEGDDLQFYEFNDEASAQRAANEVAPGGGSIGNAAMSWMAPPHFYRSGRVIAIYLGNNARVVDALSAAMGTPFAEGR